MLSTSKIYDLATKKGLNKPFKQWIEEEKALYEIRKEKFKKEMDFDTWLNLRYKGKGVELNASGNILDKALEVTTSIKDVLTGSQTQSDELKAQEAEAAKAKLDKRIFGLSPIAFYMLSGTVVAFTIYGIYRIVKKKK